MKNTRNRGDENVLQKRTQSLKRVDHHALIIKSASMAPPREDGLVKSRDAGKKTVVVGKSPLPLSQ